MSKSMWTILPATDFPKYKLQWDELNERSFNSILLAGREVEHEAAPREGLVQEGDKERELSVVLEGQLEVVRRDEISDFMTLTLKY